eukprot:6017986-Amphidinium_carterae.1
MLGLYVDPRPPKLSPHKRKMINAACVDHGVTNSKMECCPASSVDSVDVGAKLNQHLHGSTER